VTKCYEVIEHTADIGIRVKAKDRHELFEKAALAMFDIIAERKKTKSPSISKKISIVQDAQSLDELFINWLNELLSLSAVKELIFTSFKINKLDESSLNALAYGEDRNNFKSNVEIKAATYHELKVEETKNGWLAEVIFDV